MATKLDKLNNKQRHESLTQTTRDLAAILNNTGRLKKLLAISDDEWQQAEQEDNAERLDSGSTTTE